MTIEDLKNVKLSPMTAGYLAIYIKLSDLCGEAAEVAEWITAARRSMR